MGGFRLTRSIQGSPQKKNPPYERRTDLIDPTQMLLQAPFYKWSNSGLHKQSAAGFAKQKPISILRNARILPTAAAKQPTNSCGNGDTK
jgi:hypothetical protein